MDNKIYAVFDAVRADEELITEIKAFIAKKTLAT